MDSFDSGGGKFLLAAAVTGRDLSRE